MNYPDSLKNLIEYLKKLPGVGEKTAERYAISILNMDENVVENFSKYMIDCKTKIKHCKICNNITENDICDVCLDNTRNKKIICVVENIKNVVSIEKVGKFNGVYHVLNGLISPNLGITPSDINLTSLIERIAQNDIDEVIIALKPNIEGETTTLYISRLLQEKNIKISKLALGIPIGTDMEYVDTMTLEMAFDNRTTV